MSAQTAADLRAAADLIEQNGWIQGAYHGVRDGKTCHCALGAIAAVVTGEKFANPDHRPGIGSRYWAAVSKLNRTLQLDGDLETVHEWNDYQAESAAEVIAARRAAADRAEAEQ